MPFLSLLCEGNSKSIWLFEKKILLLWASVRIVLFGSLDIIRYIQPYHVILDWLIKTPVLLFMKKRLITYNWVQNKWVCQQQQIRVSENGMITKDSKLCWNTGTKKTIAVWSILIGIFYIKLERLLFCSSSYHRRRYIWIG